MRISKINKRKIENKKSIHLKIIYIMICLIISTINLNFNIIISQENLNLINNDPTAEQYVDASFIFEDKIIKDVGVRYKGSIGAFVGCLSGSDWSNPSGYKTCQNRKIKWKKQFTLSRSYKNGGWMNSSK